MERGETRGTASPTRRSVDSPASAAPAPEPTRRRTSQSDSEFHPASRDDVGLDREIRGPTLQTRESRFRAETLARPRVVRSREIFTSEQCVYERSQDGPLDGDKQAAEDDKHENDRNQSEFFSLQKKFRTSRTRENISAPSVRLDREFPREPRSSWTPDRKSTARRSSSNASSWPIRGSPS